MKEHFKYFNIKRISDKLKIHPDKMYNNLKGVYNSLTEKDYDNMARLLIPNVEKLFDRIGYKVTFTKKKPLA